MSDTDVQGAAPVDTRDLEIVELKKQRDAAETVLMKLMAVIAIGSMMGPDAHQVTSELFFKTIDEAKPIVEAMNNRKKLGGGNRNQSMKMEELCLKQSGRRACIERRPQIPRICLFSAIIA